MESPCKGGLKVSEKSLLSMLGTPKFSRKPTVSYSEQKIYDILAVLEKSGNNLNVAASKLGITKSSLKRIISKSETYSSTYDENNPLGATRRYLEKTMGNWNVAAFNPDNGTSCLEMNNGAGTVRLSVDINLNALGRVNSGI
jgi:hypothetical protein